METGKVTLSRKRSYSDSLRRGNDDLQNRRYADHDSHGIKQRDGFHVPSRRGSQVADEVLIRAGRSREYETSEESRKKQELQSRAQLSQEKKRKFSPIVWGGKEDLVKRAHSEVLEKISLDRKVSPASVIVSPVKSGSESVSEGSPSRSPGLLDQGHTFDVLTETKDHQLNCQSQINPLCHDLVLISKSPVLLNDPVETDNLQHGVLEDGEFVQERIISKSRWALEVDSPTEMSMYDGEMPELDSIESGEILGGRLGRRSVSSDELDSFEKAASGLENDGDTDVLSSYDDEGKVSPQLNDADCSDIDISKVEEPHTLVHGGIVMLNCCRNVFEYEKLNKINEGTYGIVFRAKDKKTGDVVALKKVKMNQEDSEGFPLSALREINILLSLNHPSIVNVKEVVMGDLDNSVYMVMEYMEHDLKGFMERRKRPFSTSEIKCLMVQLLEGVKYLHDNWVIHRDLKTSNLLMNNNGELKICDLGLSRQYGSELKPYTPLVVTLWYRAPELLLGTKQYSTAIDMWSIGCIMAELLANEPLFNGNTEINQIDKIFRMLGTPTEDIWPDFTTLPGAKANFVKQPYNRLRKKFPVSSFTGSTVLSASGFDLLNRLLAYDPKERISADEALKHAWFQEGPLATSKDLMPTFPAPHVVNR